MENNIISELIEKAKQAKSSEELMALAKENGLELFENDAKAYFERLNLSGELSDEELDNVSGGCGGCGDSDYDPCVHMIIASDNDTNNKGVL